jgi:hypothetical protein
MFKVVKKVLVAALVGITFFSCEKNLDVDSTPALQAVRNGTFYGADRMVAVKNADGTLTISGVNPLETLSINLSSDALGTYPLGPGTSNDAIYIFNETNAFSTSRGFGRGEVRLTPSLVPNSVSGTFDFVSYLPGQADSLYMRQGIIYQVPFGDPIDDTTPIGFVPSFNALINGADLNPVGVVPISTAGVLTLNAANNDRDFIRLSFPVNIAVGTYPIARAGNYKASYDPESTGILPAVSGTLEITAVNDAAATIEGTFSFETGPPGNFEITEGVFAIEY